MRKIILFLIVWLLLVSLQSVHSQPTWRKEIYSAYVQDDLEEWERILNNHRSEQIDPANRYEWAMAHYGFVGRCIARKEKKIAREYLKNLKELTEQLLAKNPDDPKYVALSASVMGYQLILQMHKMMIVGPKIFKTIKKAERIDDRVPQVMIESANMDWMMPAMFGGDKERAIRKYQQALQSLRKDPKSITDNWYFIYIQMVQAEWSKEVGRSNRAKGILLKILEAEPNFERAKTELESLKH